MLINIWNRNYTIPFVPIHILYRYTSHSSLALPFFLIVESWTAGSLGAILFCSCLLCKSVMQAHSYRGAKCPPPICNATSQIFPPWVFSSTSLNQTAQSTRARFGLLQTTPSTLPAIQRAGTPLLQDAWLLQYMRIS